MKNYYLIFSRGQYESRNTILPKFTKEELDNAENSKDGLIKTVTNNGMPIDYYLTKMLGTKK